MIEKIGLKNFKTFSDLPPFELAPVTILCGTNSSGKTTILQSILLLKQTIESKNPNQKILLNGRLVHLGAFNNIIHNKSPKKEIELSFSLKVKRDMYPFDTRRHIPWRYLLDGIFPDDTINNRDIDFLIDYTVTIKSSEEASSVHLPAIEIRKIELTFHYTLRDNPKIDVGKLFIEKSNVDTYFIEFSNIKNRYTQKQNIASSGKFEAIVTFSNLLPNSIEIVGDNEKKSRYAGIDMIFFRMNAIFQSFFSTTSYIGPLREEPARRYIYEDEVMEVGIKGENSAYIYLAEQDYSIGQHFFPTENGESFENTPDVLSLSSAVEKWNKLLNIIDLKAEAVGDTIQLNLFSNESKSTRVNIADVGFGVSQIFPIILEGLRLKKGGTLMLEQPEIHLHPNLQMQLADYFVSIALSNKNVIVETHSDHIINRLVRRIVEDKTLLLSRLIKIYFVRQSSQGTFLEKIEIDQKKGIINWPKDFFDQTAIEQEKIMRAALSNSHRNPS